MSQLPKGWVTATLGELCPGRVEQREPGSTPIPYIDIGSIDRATKAVSPAQTVTAKNSPTRARQWVAKGDVLVSMTRPNLNAVALVPKGLDGAVASTGFDVLRTQGVLPEWIFNRVRSHEFIADVCEGLQGVVYPAIRPSDVRRHALPVPPLAEQKRIVEAVESHSTRIDEAVATLERVQRNLKRYRASVLKASVEGRLVTIEAELARAERRDFEPACKLLERILAERRQRWEESGRRGKYDEPAPPDTSDLAEVPEGWCWATIDQLLAGIEAGKNFRCEERPPGPGEVGVVKVSAVTWGTYDEAESKTCTRPDLVSDALMVRSGDFLFSRANTIQLVGACVVVDSVTRRLMLSDKILRFSILGRLERWCLFCLRSTWGRAEIESLATGNQESMRNIGQQAIRRIRIPLPPANEVARILQTLESCESAYERTARGCSDTQRRLARLRQSILKWAFEGKLVDQDPDDEPASMLLERIKAEHAGAAPVAKSRVMKQRAKVTR